tara:strand:- start:598 stop:864 length:267 start_codon:yes stop_codon:yes gene_type:complete
MGRKKLKIIKEDCDPVDAQDKSLPTNAFLVEYRVDDASHFDLVISAKQVDIFDHYYDQYKKNFVTMNQAEGRINPKLWGIESKEKKKK